MMDMIMDQTFDKVDFAEEYRGVSEFEECRFVGCSFCDMDIVGCSLIQCDFSECNLSKSIFSECDLSSAIFNSTNLEGADFSTARNYTINPQSNRVKNAKFSLPDVVGLLANLDIKVMQG